MGILKRRKIPQTRIVRRGQETVSVVAPRIDLGTAVATPRWELRRDEFRGFGSPPGKF
jgi:hypothetical protein